MLNLKLDKDSILPGEPIRGVVGWSFDQPVHAIELRLVWLRSGIGEPEATVVQTLKIPCSSYSGESSFDFDGIHSPYSYVGKLFSIEWLVEASASAGVAPEARRFTMSPTLSPVVMRSVSAVLDSDGDDIG
jgi:hypothetical protein